MRDYFKAVTGKTRKEAFRRPSSQEILEKQWKELLSGKRSDVFSLGVSQEQGEILISEGERENQIHVLGSIGEGKSKFLEYLMRHDIDRLKADEHLHKNKRRSCGLCFIDPSPNGATMYQVLAYCAKIDFRKVLIIDAKKMRETDSYVAINPLIFPIEQVLDAFRILFDVKEMGSAAKVEFYLPLIFKVLQNLELPLARALPFIATPSNAKNEFDQYAFERDEILYQAKALNTESMDLACHQLRFAYRNYLYFNNEVSSTSRRLYQAIGDETLKIMFSSWNGINFNDLVSEGWVVLVNVSDRSIGDFPGRFLSTVIINQIIDSIVLIRESGFNKPYHLYIDEAGKFATRKIQEVLDYMRQIKLRLVLSHQHMGQLQHDPLIEKAIRTSTKIKVAFFIAGTKERRDVMDMLGYGGKIDPDDVSYSQGDQKKQQFIVKLAKASPVLARAYDVPSCHPNFGFMTNIFNTNNYAREDTLCPPRGSEPDSPAAGTATKSSRKQRVQNAKKTKETGSAKTASVWDKSFVETGGGQEKKPE